uniref:Uncharacterized protein n=1 Tax=Sphingobacterium sp. (strain 21) TaxID=743722 RepID=F4C813_SPHS2
MPFLLSFRISHMRKAIRGMAKMPKKNKLGAPIVNSIMRNGLITYIPASKWGNFL